MGASLDVIVRSHIARAAADRWRSRRMARRQATQTQDPTPRFVMWGG
jgi:hypothetical protein